MKCVYFDKETEKIIDDNFTKGKWGHKLFSKIIKKLLTDYVSKKPTMENLKMEKNKLQKQIRSFEDELIEVECQFDQLISEAQKKYTINENEAAYLNDSRKIIRKDKSKKEARIKSYSKIFSKTVDYDDFEKLMLLARETFPKAKGYVEESDE